MCTRCADCVIVDVRAGRLRSVVPNGQSRPHHFANIAYVDRVQ